MSNRDASGNEASPPNAREKHETKPHAPLVAQDASKYKLRLGGREFCDYNDVMDRTSLLVVALRETALRLTLEETPYKWAHFGQCNCGHLAQTLTRLPALSLQRAAEVHQGDWAEQAITWEKRRERERTDVLRSNASFLDAALPDYGDRPALDEGAWEPEGIDRCTTTYLPMADVFNRLASIGLTADDLVHLERLSDPRIRKHLGNNTQDFHYADRANVVRYLLGWADLLEREAGAPHEVAYALAAE